MDGQNSTLIVEKIDLQKVTECPKSLKCLAQSWICRFSTKNSNLIAEAARQDFRHHHAKSRVQRWFQGKVQDETAPFFGTGL
jgi:hypothetical protein